MAKNTLDETRELLRKRLDKYKSRCAGRKEIADAAGLNYHWLEKFDQGVPYDTKWSRLWALNCFLRGKNP